MLTNRNGQSLVEYLILVCLVAVSSIAVVSVVGQNIKAQYAKISNLIQGNPANSVRMESVDENAYQGRGMNDFSESSRYSGGRR